MNTKHQSPIEVMIEVYTRKYQNNKTSLSASLFLEVIELARNLRSQELQIVNVAYTEGYKDAMEEAKKTLKGIANLPEDEL